MGAWLRRGTARERPVTDVPVAVRAGVAVLLVAQIVLSRSQPGPAASAQALPDLPAAPVLRAVGLGDPIPLAQLLILYLQAFDNQPGVSIPFLQLDYGRVERWLNTALELDPRGQYPLLMAAQVYGQVPDRTRQRQMLDLVYRRFQDDPNQRWRWLAHASIMAEHRLQDSRLALQYARALREQATGPRVPGWARQMEVFLHEDAGEYAAAQALLGGLLDSGAVTDVHELRFLAERLSALEAAEKSSSASKRRLPPGAPAEAAER